MFTPHRTPPAHSPRPEDSRTSSRGALIVIKIEIDENRTDRIFLHQHDDDMVLAHAFLRKNELPPSLTTLIYDKIQVSRQSIETSAQAYNQVDQCKVQTPYQVARPAYPQVSSLPIEPEGESPQPLFKDNDHKVEAAQSQVHNQFQLYERQPESNSSTKHAVNRIQQALEEHDRREEQQLGWSRNSSSNRESRRSVAESRNSKGGKIKIMTKEEVESLHSTLRRSMSSRKDLGKSMSRQQLSRINKDVTNRLYNQAQIKKNYLRKIKEKAKIEQQEKHDPQLTHRPCINPLSEAIAEGRRNQQTVEEHLLDEGKKKQLKIQEQVQRKCMEEVEGCSFQPQMNLLSQRLAAERADNRVSSVRCKGQPAPFRPIVNKISTELMKEKGKFEERQRDYLQHRNTRLMEKVKEKQQFEKYDSESGQQLYRPRINTTGKSQSRRTDIGNHLYQLSKESRVSSIRQVNSVKTSDASEKIAMEMRMRRISWLFAELDSDQDGVISATNIQISGIDGPLLNIIKPILFEMEEMSEQLTLSEFRQAVEILHCRLNAQQKGILYNLKQPSSLRS